MIDLSFSASVSISKKHLFQPYDRFGCKRMPKWVGRCSLWPHSICSHLRHLWCAMSFSRIFLFCSSMHACRCEQILSYSRSAWEVKVCSCVCTGVCVCVCAVGLCMFVCVCVGATATCNHLKLLTFRGVRAC